MWLLLYGDGWKFGDIEMWIKSHPPQNKKQMSWLSWNENNIKINKLNVYKFSVVNIKHEGGKLKDLKRLCLQKF